jgi:hypothetical protein
MLREFQEEI